MAATATIASLSLTLFATVLAYALADLSNIHQQMSIDDLRDIFHVDSHHLVPEYEVVRLSHVRKRSIDYNGPRTQNRPSKIHNEKIVYADKSLSKSASNTLNGVQFVDNLVLDSNKQTNSLLASEVNSLAYLDSESKINHLDLNSATVQDPSGITVVADEHSESTFKPEVKVDDQTVQEENIQLSVFGKNLSLTLVPTEGLLKKEGLKVWHMEPNSTSEHGVDYIEMENDEDDHIGEIYQDEENEAAILLRRDKETGSFLVEGSIGKDLVIKPLPKHLRQNKPPPPPNYSDDEMFLNEDDLESEVSIDTGLPIKRSKRDIVKLSHHVIYKRKLNNDDYLGDYAFMEPDHLSKRYRRSTILDDETSDQQKNRRSKREAPYVIYPEILVIVDYDGYRLHGGDNVQIKRYFVSFWNGVDLRYKLLKGPKVRISIAGIIISRGRDATPYLERNRVGRDAIDSAAALTDMGKYLFRERRLPVYDIAVAITKLDMCRRQFANDVCNRGTAGFAYVGGACVVNKRLEKVNSVAIIEDTGGFSGIIVAAHEVGHLLGAVHDGSPPPSYLGGPGAEKCRWEDGYIMSDLRHTERGFRWSPCSVQAFHHFLNGDTATCLFNSPHEDESLGRVLPGKLLTLDAQCRKDRGTSACFKDDRVCAQLFCFDAGSGYCVAYRPAAEGSPCGDGQFCTNGRCVAEHENIIPDYSQNTPAYIRRGQETAATDLQPVYVNYTTYRYNYNEDSSTTQNPYDYYQQQHSTSTENPYSLYYQQQKTTESPYYTISTTNPTTNYYHYTTTTTTTTTTRSPYKYTFTSTRNPYNFHEYFKSTSTTKSPNSYYSTTRHPYVSTTTKNPFSTKNPYSTTRNTYGSSTTKNPYVGDYYKKITSTTKNPYNFANFGQSTTTNNPYSSFEISDHRRINNNYLKRSSNYFGAASANIRQNNTRQIGTVQNGK